MSDAQTSSSINWQLGDTPTKQSITEVLQDPRAPALELPDISTIDLSASSLTLTPTTPTQLPPPHNINHFEPYLRRYAPLYASYRKQVHAPPRLSALPGATTPPRDTPDNPQNEEHAVPSQFFHSSFDLASHSPLADLPYTPNEPLSSHPDLPNMRVSLHTHQRSLEHRLQHVLNEQAATVETALQNLTALRSQLLSTAAKLRETRSAAATLLPIVVNPLESTHRLVVARQNVVTLRKAAASLHAAATAPANVALLLEAGAYAAAIECVHVAKGTLALPQLSGVHALSGVRRKLANAVEVIDAGLRREFRTALHDGDEDALTEVVVLVRRMGRLALLQRFFTKEICDGFAGRLAQCNSLAAAKRVAVMAAERAVMLSRIVNVSDRAEVNGGDGGDTITREEANGGVVADADALRSLLVDFEELLATFIDKLWLPFEPVDGDGKSVSPFIVLTKDDALSEESCFDEFKAALKFGEELRDAIDLATRIETLFAVEKRGSPFRAKLAERQIAFVTAFHRSHVDVITGAVQADKWQEVAVSKGALKLLAAVVPGAVDGVREGDSSGGGSGGGRSAIVSTFVVDGKGYRTVSCGVRFVRSACAYTLLTEQSTTLGAEVARRGTELSRVFNSLVWKAILGVAALQWSGLRSITARHLSLSSRTIDLAHVVSVRVHETMEQALQSAAASRAAVVVPLMRKVESDLAEHHAQLLAKIVEIMLDRLRAHEDALRALPWDVQQDMARLDVPSLYVVTLEKETTVLHRILWYILPQHEAIEIFRKVWLSYGNRLSDAYGSLDGGKKWIRNRVARDVASLYETLRMLELSRVSGEAFKPIAELYKRFAHEYLQEVAAKEAMKEATSAAMKRAGEEASKSGARKAVEEGAKVSEKKVEGSAPKVAEKKAAEAEKVAVEKAEKEAATTVAKKVMEEAAKVAAKKGEEDVAIVAPEKGAETVPAKKAEEDAEIAVAKKTAEAEEKSAAKKAEEEAAKVAAEKVEEDAANVTAKKAVEAEEKVAPNKAEAAKVEAKKAEEEATKVAAKKAEEDAEIAEKTAEGEAANGTATKVEEEMARAAAKKSSEEVVRVATEEAGIGDGDEEHAMPSCANPSNSS